MKKEYIKPIMELAVFDVENVITTSGEIVPPSYLGEKRISASELMLGFEE